MAMTEFRNMALPSSWPAPAKLNLFLRVTGRRPDGYHDLQTLFQLLDWGDELQILPAENSQISRVGPDFGVPEAEDLSLRAARLLQRTCNVSEGANIRVEKRIPMGSGMGGGSSDAATVLLVLNRAWGCGLNLDDLARLGATLGADVPVFVKGRSALASGIGDRLQPVSLGRRHYVLVFPGFSIATTDVFGDPSLVRNSRLLAPSHALESLGHNDCEAVVRRRFPAMNSIMEKLRKWGDPVLTGTGSGIFLLMKDKKLANSTAREIKTLYNGRAVIGVDRSPVHEKLYPDGI